MDNLNRKINNLPKDKLTQYELKSYPKFNWADYLKNEKDFKYDIYSDSQKIGTIELISRNNQKIFNITYEMPIKHDIFITEYDIDDNYFHVSELGGHQFAIGINHPFQNILNAPLNGKHLQHNKSYVSQQFSYVLNAIVADNNKLNFINISCMDHRD